MNFKRIIIIIFFITSCTNTKTLQNNKIIPIYKYSNAGFALVYDYSENVKRKVSKRIDKRSLLVYQKNLKKGTTVKVVNLINSKSILATVGSNVDYPYFYNSVLSERIAKEIDLDVDEPYIKILTLDEDNIFIAKKAKTFDEEKKVANKAPVDGISINDLSNSSKNNKNKKQKNKNFKYIVKIAEFYFEKSALLMKKRILNDTNIKNVKINKLSKNLYRVYIGPYNNLISLKNAYNDVSQLEFENIEIIKL